MHLVNASPSNQSLEPTAGRCAARMKDEVKAMLALASGGSAPSSLMFPRTHAWSRAQKCLLIAAVLIALAAFGTLVYSVERRYGPPDGNILAGTWEMIAPHSKDGSTILRLDPEWTAAWHRGAWVRCPTAGQQGHSEMMWYAGGRYIYMHFEDGLPQIWQIIQILPDELRLRHAKRDYTFKRI
jgi:hypothetical protein